MSVGISVYRFFTIFEFADIDGMAIEKISLYRLSLIFCFFPIFTIIISIKSRHPIVHRTPYTLDALPCVLRYTTTRLGNGENPKYQMMSSLISQDARRKLTRACFGRLAIYRILTIYFQRYINTENLLYRRTLFPGISHPGGKYRYFLGNCQPWSAPIYSTHSTAGVYSHYVYCHLVCSYLGPIS